MLKTEAVVRLHDLFTAAGIPIHGISKAAGVFTVQYNNATAQQQTAGAAIIAAFDGKALKARPLLDIYSDIVALSASDKNKLLAAIGAEFLRDNPKFAKALNINISGDEVES